MRKIAGTIAIIVVLAWATISAPMFIPALESQLPWNQDGAVRQITSWIFLACLVIIFLFGGLVILTSGADKRWVRKHQPWKFKDRQPRDEDSNGRCVCGQRLAMQVPMIHICPTDPKK